MINMETKAGEMVTGQGCGLVLVDVTRGVLRPTGHHWFTLFPYLSRLRTVRCHLGGCQVTDLLIPSTYWQMGARKTCYSLIVGSGSIRTN
jgi:hypothetical protein